MTKNKRMILTVTPDQWQTLKDAARNMRKQGYAGYTPKMIAEAALSEGIDIEAERLEEYERHNND